MAHASVLQPLYEHAGAGPCARRGAGEAGAPAGMQGAWGLGWGWQLHPRILQDSAWGGRVARAGVPALVSDARPGSLWHCPSWTIRMSCQAQPRDNASTHVLASWASLRLLGRNWNLEQVCPEHGRGGQQGDPAWGGTCTLQLWATLPDATRVRAPPYLPAGPKSQPAVHSPQHALAAGLGKGVRAATRGLQPFIHTRTQRTHIVY